jgi:hypothetical protein
MPIIKNDHTIDGETVTIYIETDQAPKPDSPYGDMRGPADKVIAAARDVFGDGLQLANSCAQRFVEAVKEMNAAVRPDEFKVQLAIKLDANVGAVLAKFGSEAQMQVSMKWVRKEDA